MHEFYEFRVPEEYAHRLFRPEEGDRLSAGKNLPPTTRKILLPSYDPRLPQVGELNREYREGTTIPRYFFAGWDIHRRYTKRDLEAAELFSLEITAAFEPEGESCGTAYDESTACPHCGADRTQVTDLRLDLRKAPKTKDIARTIADEWIVS